MADTDDIQERIRRRAHELWEREGHPHGRDADHWAQAEAEIRGAGALVPTEKVAGSRKKSGGGKATGKSTRAAAESLSEVANAPAETRPDAATPPKTKASAKPPGKSKARANPSEETTAPAPAKTAGAKSPARSAANAPPAKPQRTGKKDNGKTASAG
ncbi:hypothetical protein A6A40_26230 (plasmid) [Azospirillum humicireducens]|uniref:DUF2934 domain-containing protein n=1 Tax=Azospirillum humicireducens TaxID=1226968 RepID=A0A2R4VVR0_9PROT|nr:DUF2934 domain-containing protein [Azospirillum humicireducens]AWB08505.1 hypothetical protein A6A40_26230 [Azospirillum humicireducens]